ncbi:MAG: hypothetical protein ACRET6_11155, partial [Burkholderiales bacterium]
MSNQHVRAGAREGGRANLHFTTSRSPDLTGVTRHWSLVTLLLAVAGCGPQPYVMEGNYLTYDHPFSEASAAAVRKNAEGICRQRDQTAVETSRACSLTQCTTNYQCM